MMVALDAVAVVCAGVRTARALDDVRRFDLRFATRKVCEKNLFFVAVFAFEAKIPLSGGKGVHAFDPRFLTSNGERNGAQKRCCSYKARGLGASSRNGLVLYDFVRLISRGHHATNG